MARFKNTSPDIVAGICGLLRGSGCSLKLGNTILQLAQDSFHTQQRDAYRRDLHEKISDAATRYVELGYAEIYHQHERAFRQRFESLRSLVDQFFALRPNDDAAAPRYALVQGEISLVVALPHTLVPLASQLAALPYAPPKKDLNPVLCRRGYGGPLPSILGLLSGIESLSCEDMKPAHGTESDPRCPFAYYGVDGRSLKGERFDEAIQKARVSGKKFFSPIGLVNLITHNPHLLHEHEKIVALGATINDNYMFLIKESEDHLRVALLSLEQIAQHYGSYAKPVYAGIISQ